MKESVPYALELIKSESRSQRRGCALGEVQLLHTHRRRGNVFLRAASWTEIALKNAEQMFWLLGWVQPRILLLFPLLFV